MQTELARAKVNLCLHVTDRRADGLHVLDSLVVFPKFGDEITISESDEYNLLINGLFGKDLSVEDNLITKALELFPVKEKFKVTLAKNLPVASGIGGGSADAAAIIRVMSKRFDEPSLSEQTKLGADIPVCVQQRFTRMQGIGDRLSILPQVPKFWMVLVNAGVLVHTGEVFSKLDKYKNTALEDIPAEFDDAPHLFSYLQRQRNDLQKAAVSVCPVIHEVLREIQQTSNCALARMSGSGGTCFGIFKDKKDADFAVETIKQKHSSWWCVAAEVNE